jgi:hypothetical protein
MRAAMRRDCIHENSGGGDAAESAAGFRSSTGLSSETVRCACPLICANPVLATFPFDKTLAMKSQRCQARVFQSGAGRFFLRAGECSR